MNAVLKGVSLGDDVVVELQTIAPKDATAWLQCNTHNRPVRRAHVKFLARQIMDGQWQLNGQAIIVADTNDILDGQHRLLAVIDAGMAIKSLVVYGITREAFKTIDTGAVRTAADALALWHPEAGGHRVKDISAAVRWLQRLEAGFYGTATKMSNTDVLEYVAAHPSIWRSAEMLAGMPHETRPLPMSCGIALLEMLSRKHKEQAAAFIHALYTGEELVRTNPEMVLRTMLLNDAKNHNKKYSGEIKMRMAVKAWNLRVRGREGNRQGIAVTTKDPEKYPIF